MLPQNLCDIFKIFRLNQLNQLNYQYETQVATLKPIITKLTTKIAAAAAAAATTTTTVSAAAVTTTTKCFIMFFITFVLMLQRPPLQVWAGSCREAQLCCNGRDSSCVVQKAPMNSIIEDLNDKPCYCDHACLKLGDCCMDFKDHCGVVDCQVSDWGQWSDCDVACGMGIMVKTRYIIQAPQNGGKHCATLMQKRGCQGFRCHGHREKKILRETALLLPATLSSSKRHINGSQDDIHRYRDTYKHNRELEYCVEFEVLKASKACHKLPSYNLMIEGDRITVRCDLEAFVYEHDSYMNKNNSNGKSHNNKPNNVINGNKTLKQANSQLNLNELFANNYSLRNHNKNNYNSNNNNNNNNNNDNKWTENNDSINDNEDDDDDNNDDNVANDNNGSDNDNDNDNADEDLNENNDDVARQNDKYNYNDHAHDNDNNDNDNNYHYYGMKRIKFYNNKISAKSATSVSTKTSIMKTPTATTPTTSVSSLSSSASSISVDTPTATTQLHYHCRGEGLSGRTTRWSALAAPSCHGKWLRLTVGVPKPCIKEQFIFV